MRITACLVLALAACGSDSDLVIDATESNVCNEIAEVACHNLFNCCSEGEIEDFLGVDEPRTEVQCRDDVIRLCGRSIAQREFSISQGRSQFDATRMNTCLQALIAPEGQCATIADVLPWTEACMNDAWVGTVGDGGECLAPFECASADSVCASTLLCTPLPKQGETCAVQCATGLFCDAGKCAQKLGQGAECTSDAGCQDDLFCDLQVTAPEKPTCQVRGEGGAACTTSSGCRSNQCVPALCAGTNPRSCFTDNDCFGHCSDDQSFCFNQFDCGFGRCSVNMNLCFDEIDCPTAETCVFAATCVKDTCSVGEPACAEEQVVVDYCQGALAELPFP